MTFEQNLKDARKKSGFTQTELAAKLEVKQKDISRWENGERTPSLNTLIKICNTLNVSADELLGIK